MPAFLASESPMAIACFRLVTRLPLRPILSSPCFIAFISLSTLFPAAGEYFRVDFFAAVGMPILPHATQMVLGSAGVASLQAFSASGIESICGELCEQAGARWLINEGSAQSFAVAGQQVLACPMEMLAQASILLPQCHAGNGACVGADAERDTVPVEAVDGMIGICEAGASLHIAGGAHFKMNALTAKVVGERWVFNAAHAMTDACWLEGLQGFPDAGCARRFSGMGGAIEAVVDCIAEGGDVGRDGKSSFVSCDIEGCDAGALELLDNLRGEEALFLAEVAEGAEDHASLNAGGTDALLGRTVDDCDYGLGR